MMTWGLTIVLLSWSYKLRLKLHHFDLVWNLINNCKGFLDRLEHFHVVCADMTDRSILVFEYSLWFIKYILKVFEYMLKPWVYAQNTLTIFEYIYLNFKYIYTQNICKNLPVYIYTWNKYIYTRNICKKFQEYNEIMGMSMRMSTSMSMSRIRSMDSKKTSILILLQCRLRLIWQFQTHAPTKLPATPYPFESSPVPSWNQRNDSHWHDAQ